MADDTGNGLSWATAAKVHVKNGTYNITNTIVMASGCELLGGWRCVTAIMMGEEVRLSFRVET